MRDLGGYFAYKGRHRDDRDTSVTATSQGAACPYTNFLVTQVPLRLQEKPALGHAGRASRLQLPAQPATGRASTRRCGGKRVARRDLSAVPGPSLQDLNYVRTQSFTKIPNSHVRTRVDGTCRRPHGEGHREVVCSGVPTRPRTCHPPGPTGALQPRLLTKNSGSPNGEKSIVLTLTGLGPRWRGLKHLGGTLRPCLAP